MQKTVETFVSYLTEPTKKYDLSAGNKIIAEFYDKKTKTIPALSYLYDRIMLYREKSGCSFTYSGALAYLMHSHKIKTAIIGFDDGYGLSHAVAYCVNGKILVCDIGNYIKGKATITECASIPIKEFVYKFRGKVWLHDLRLIDGPFITTVMKRQSNTSYEEFAKQ